MSNKKILIIGKSGQLGSALLGRVKSFDYDMVAFGKDELNVLDLNSVLTKIDIIKPAILINTSAYHVVPKCESEPQSAMAVNFIAVRNLARICKERGIKFVTYSTDYVFDGEKKSPYEENDLPNPLQVYGLSKLAGEYAALEIFPQGSYIIRTNGLYGGHTGSPEKGGNFVLNIIKESQDKDLIEVSSEQIVDPTYAVDLADATLKLLMSEAVPGIYHLINEGECSWHEFTKEIFRLAGIDKELKPVDRGGVSGAMKRPKYSVLKNTKASALGIILPTWQDGLREYFDFLSNAKS